MKISYPPDLPVSARRDDIAAAIRDHQVVIVAGETGSGKTTQLPKICLELGRGTPGEDGRPRMIGHTQPRRIAARSVSERIAEELGTELGDVVGYQVRFTDKTSKQSRIKLMTDGILLAELQRDRLLRRYDTIIIDEAHERSLNIDFLLGYLRQLLPRRPDLKIIITSATIDPERFAQHFADVRTGEPAPIVEVSGRTYPVEIRYRPLMDLPEDDADGEPIVRDQTEAIVDAVKELSAEGPGDILVFLPGEREIRDTAEALAPLGDGIRGVDVLPLYSRLSAAEQHRVFAPAKGSRRRVVLATNVAETSLTVPGIRYVIDTGVARISRYSARTKVQRLPIEPISQASANQRSGRCGRVAAGIAVRLYDEEDFEARPEFTDPEILRTNLASVILQMTSLGLGDIARFPFVEPPDRRNVQAGVQLLEELGAVSAKGDLTKTGRRLARLPIDPRLGRMLLEAERLGCVRDVLVIVAALSLQDPRERPGADHPVEQAQADQLHARFKAERSDFLTWLNLWNHLRQQQKELSGSAFRRMCKREFLNYLRVREWQEFVAQLRQVTKEMGVRLEAPGDVPDADGIHQALLSGLLSHVGLLEEREKSSRSGPGARKDGRRPGPREYLGARGARFAIFPGSGLARKNPQFLMAGELVETGRLWARQNAEIQPEWAERLGAHLVKRSYSEPHWSRKRQAVMANERVTLYGVPLAADRPVNYARIDPELSRELFIRHALVHGEWDTRHHFLRDNKRLLEEAEELEHRARRRDLVVDEHTLFDFYDARVPADAVSGAHFDRWWRDERRKQPNLLTFDPAMLTHDAAEEVSEADYPEEWSVAGGLTFPISYHFEPGAQDDGLTIDIPVSTLNRVDDDDFSWIVPGLREQLVVELIRGLPKALRVNFVPAPNTAREFLAAVPAGEEALLGALERYLRSTTGIHVPRDAWDLAALPAHLSPTYRVVDERGRVQGRGKSLADLKAPLQPQFDEALAAVASDSGVARTGETDWVFDEIPVTATWTRAGHEVEAFPGLVDEGTTVGLQVSGSADERDARHRLGVVRLLLLALGNGPTKGIADALSNAEKLGLAGTPYPSTQALLADCLRAVVVDAVDAREPVRTREGYDALLAALRTSAASEVRATLAELLRVLEVWREVDRLLSGRADLPLLPALTDLQGQLGRLVFDGFVGEAGTTRLRRHRTYLAAMRERRTALENGGPAALAKDRQRMDLVQPMQEAWLARVDALPEGRPPGAGLRAIRWMLEEYRVSQWAQQLGVDGPVSDVRLRKAFDALG
ncbi:MULTISPECIES: ATP-dependent RNA helicase HrpA [unclassified Nocardioides]|uniref:ATP-dependent RNA helicase HrpA n=1 Tax=unclassified Nocardioides TaxID=2615069 RepID=UPI0007027659|nr:MULTISPECIES: ATP-dependent RNA helicase HrpA [unclassified Nocardioides]KRC51432.1 ATP-dependent RNA helicase HrpA [Nocardioides sp. Root79]KRC69042.1 ATP-dependent RNA helicase HrpA [Nocardioides sp. Root240]